MKCYIITFFVFLIPSFLLAQVICDDNICTNKIQKKDLFPSHQNDPAVLKEIAVKKRDSLKSQRTLFDLNCDYPSFWAFTTINGITKKKIVTGKALGTSIRVYREESCDLAKSTLAVPINFNNDEHWAVTGYEGDPVFLDKGFIILITDDNYWCDGLPVDPTVYHSCKKCRKKYASQLFRAKIGNEIIETTYYCYARGECNGKTNHDDLSLIDNKGCAKSKGNKFKRN